MKSHPQHASLLLNKELMKASLLWNEELMKASLLWNEELMKSRLQQAQLFIAEIKSEFPDANHNCLASLFGLPGNTDQVGMSDDGGMVKAYTAAVKTALEQVPVSERVDWVHMRATIDYALVTPFQRRITEFEIEIIDTDYGELVTYQIRMPKEHSQTFRSMFDDLTAGQGVLELLDFSSVPTLS